MTAYTKGLDLTFSLETGPAGARDRLILAHGAGAGIESPFFASIMDLLAARGIATTGFEFSYMSARRTGGSKRPPPKAETLTAEYRDTVRSLTKKRKNPWKPVIGGKSMGLKAGISSELILIIQSIIIFFMAAEGGIRRMLGEKLAARRARRAAVKAGREAKA